LTAVLGAALVLGASAALGHLLARPYRRRPRELAALQVALHRLATEVRYAVPLPQALRAAGSGACPPVRRLFEGAAEQLGSPRGATAAEAWEQALAAADPLSAWLPADRQILLDLGHVLGASGRAEQRRHLEHSLERLAAAEAEARAEAERQARMWVYLGVLGGAALVILCL
jgi:stage III sporulation protein AB